MKDRKLSYRRLAKAAGLHVSSLHRMVHGTQPVNTDELAALATALGVAPADLLPQVAPTDAASAASVGHVP